MAGSLQNTASSRSDGNCVEVSRGEWSGPESSFEMEWVQQRSVAHGSMIAHWETHVQQMHGNLTQRSATNWDHYMDYKACFLFDDCKLILQQLNRDAVPYFLVPHADFFGVHIQAPGGIVVEAICPTTSKGDMPESLRGQRDLVATRVQAARLYIAPWAQRNRRRRCRHGSWLDVDAAARAYRHKADIFSVILSNILER